MIALIVEDESAASRRLVRMLSETAPQIRVAEVLETICDTVSWLMVNRHPDLIFCDIHLADGSCFNIFKQVDVKCPVIFITAYDQYAIDAFKVNGIDYILKPVRGEELNSALQKFQNLIQPVDYSRLLEQLQATRRDFQQRIIVKSGQLLKAVDVAQIAIFYAEDGVVFIQTFEGQRLIPDLTLDRVMQIVDPSMFFRVNRGQVINHRAVFEMHLHTKGRLKLRLQLKQPQECMVSADKVSGFKAWLTGAQNFNQR